MITTIGWILVIIGALINYLAKPVLKKLKSANEDSEQKLLLAQIEMMRWNQ